MSLTALEWGLRAPITPRFGGNLGALPRLQGTEPKQQQKSDLKHKKSDRSVVGGGFDQPAFSFNESAGFLPTQSAIPRQYSLFEKYISEVPHDKILNQNLNSH